MLSRKSDFEELLRRTSEEISLEEFEDLAYSFSEENISNIFSIAFSRQ